MAATLLCSTVEEAEELRLAGQPYEMLLCAGCRHFALRRHRAGRLYSAGGRRKLRLASAQLPIAPNPR